MAAAGCVPNLIAEPVVEWCAKNEPQYFTEAEWVSMTAERQNFWIAYNEYGEDNCGWVPVHD